MIKKLALGLMLGLCSLQSVASTFEESPEYARMSDIFRKSYEVISNLEPIEILLPKQPKIYNQIYGAFIESNFHNVITPTLMFSIRSEVKRTLDFRNNYPSEEYEIGDHITPTLMQSRDQMLCDIIKRAADKAFEETAVQYRQYNEEALEPDDTESLFVVLRHFKKGH